ncbi:hypothetical protein Baya_0294 [Bagarius yarrelli]|uniref:Uncharacterized protein n=1 Tax=Bagarius yarrelli TaxID=175774 RepID=A0A556THU5_BAGYA|nr:hypothetical protein Baya_0294 [Bagarius yarrelli]
MHKAYQPLKPTANRFLQRKWDQERYDEHRKKVREAKPVVDTRGFRTPTHIQAKLKKAQVQEERQAIINRDNQLLATKIADIQHSKGRVDHQNTYPERSLNFERRKARLLQVSHENQMIHERITAQESEYRRELWEEEWKMKKSVKFLGGAPENTSSIIEDRETTDEDLRLQ